MRTGRDVKEVAEVVQGCFKDFDRKFGRTLFEPVLFINAFAHSVIGKSCNEMRRANRTRFRLITYCNHVHPNAARIALRHRYALSAILCSAMMFPAASA